MEYEVAKELGTLVNMIVREVDDASEGRGELEEYIYTRHMHIDVMRAPATNASSCLP